MRERLTTEPHTVHADGTAEEWFRRNRPLHAGRLAKRVIRNRRHMRERIFHREEIATGGMVVDRIQQACSSLVCCLSFFSCSGRGAPLSGSILVNCQK